MSKITSQKQIEKQFLAEMGTELNDVSETHLEDLKLTESVSKSVSENIPTSKKTAKKDDKKKNVSIFAGITDQIYGILGNSKVSKEIILPSITIQKKRVKKSLEKEKSRLISQANKIKNSRKFNASALEKTIAKIRHIQEMIDEMFSFAKEKITELYKKYYLKVG